ncbi:mandelate racemase/muconate lactonizing enzyme family protein [Halopenitus salinus]|uniref:Mandelate racemase/muconate lactonizing enzyme family protein n=1 Tax=Halopenitus salinus TaxID=1198295 RepID=A0ABD5UUH7_9EURY
MANDSKYRQLVADMMGGIGWRDLRETDQRRAPDRDVEITDIKTAVVEGNFPWVLVKVETDADVYGLGEAFPGPAGEHVEFLKPGLVGQNPLDIDRLTEHMTQLLSGLGGSTGYSQAAVSGIEIALWDIAGKLTGLPVYQLLGGKYRDEVQIYADCHAGENLAEATSQDPRDVYSPESYAEAAREVIDEGFGALKFDLDVKIEDADTATRRLSRPAIQHKVDIVRAVREEIGYEPTLGFDLHWNFSVETATKIAREVEEYDLDWIEDPVPPESAETHRKVSESTSTPILAGENLTRVEDFLPFFSEQALDVAAPDIQKCGGLLEFRKIATVADAFDVPIAPHNISSPIGTMASVHVCATVPNAFALEWHAREVPWWDDMHTENADLIQDGAIDVPEEPGLGVTLDPDTVEAHLAPGEELFEL